MNQPRRFNTFLLLILILCSCTGSQNTPSTPNLIHYTSDSGGLSPTSTSIREIQITKRIPTPTDVPEERFTFGSLRKNILGRIIVYNEQFQSYQIIQADQSKNLGISSDEYPVFAGFSEFGILAYAFNRPEFFLHDPDDTVRSISINSEVIYDLLPEGARIWGWQTMRWINENLIYAQLLYTTEPDQVKKSKLSIVLTEDGKLREDLFISLSDRLTGSAVLFSPTLEQVVFAEKETFVMKDIKKDEVIYSDNNFNNLLFSREGQIFEAMWSPDGAYVVYVNLGAFTQGIVLVDSKGNKQYISPENYRFTGDCGLSWSKNSQYITFIGTDADDKNQFLYIYDVIKKKIIYKIKTEEVLQTPIVQWAPYDLEFAISDWTYKNIYLYDLENGLKEKLIDKGKVFSWGK